MALIGELIVVLGGMGAPLTASLLKAEGELKAFGTTAGTTAAKTSAILGGIGLVGIAGLALAVKSAADFEDAMTGVRKTVDEADLAAAGLTFEGLGLQFRQMATELPVSAVELAHIGETAGALGIKAKDIESFTRTIAMLGITTDLSTSQAAESLGRVGTILGLTGGDWAAYADILVNLGNQGASTESQIQGVVERFAGAGMQAGLTTPQILAFSSAIANVVADPEAAGSSLSRLFGGMVLGAANGTKAGQAFAKTTGMAFTEWSNLVKTDTVGAMLLLLDSLQGLDQFGQAQALKAMGITQVRDVNAIRALASTYETNLIPAIEYANESQGAAAIETEKRLKSLNAQLDLLGNAFTELGISVGTSLLPPLTDFVQKVTGVVDSVSEWAAANPGLAGTIFQVASALLALSLGMRLVGFLLGPISLIGSAIVSALGPSAAVTAAATAEGEVIGTAIGIGLGPAIALALPLAIAAAIAIAVAAAMNTPTDKTGIPGEVFPIGHGFGPSSGHGREVPWGTFNSPGFEAGVPGSPFQGPKTPLGMGFQPWGSFNTPGFHAGEAGSPFAGPKTPIQINNNTTVVLDGEKVGTIMDRRQYDYASLVSSGYSTTDNPRQ